jgi:hypothetical protein
MLLRISTNACIPSSEGGFGASAKALLLLGERLA